MNFDLRIVKSLIHWKEAINFELRISENSDTLESVNGYLLIKFVLID